MPNDQRGMTLTEVTITMVLASIVMFGLIGFYLNSQGTWMDASAKAITQREITTLVETLSERVHAATEARFYPATHQLDLHDLDGNVQYVYWWNVGGGEDSLVHEGPSRADDRGSPISSTCEQFDVVTDESLVRLDITLRSGQKERISVHTRIALLNRRPPAP